MLDDIQQILVETETALCFRMVKQFKQFLLPIADKMFENLSIQYLLKQIKVQLKSKKNSKVFSIGKH